MFRVACPVDGALALAPAATREKFVAMHLALLLASALVLRPPVTRVRSGLVRLSEPAAAREPLSWQEELETILSPRTASSDREVLLKDLLVRGPQIAEEVGGALASGNLEALLPPRGETRRIADDLGAVRKQLEEVVEEAAEEARAGRLPEVAQEAARDAAEASQRGPTVAASLLSDPARALELVRREATNVVSRTPDGLDSPSYDVVGHAEGYELRRYASHGVAATTMDAAGRGASSGLLASSRGFSRLSAFIFGENARGETLEMTTPVRVDVDTDGAAMAFALPRELSASSAPAPSDARVRLRQTEVATVAVAQFGGYATPKEIERQRETLLAALARDGVQVDGAGERYTIYQYNPPYTLPFLRRNEIAMPVVLPQAESVEAGGAGEEAGAVADSDSVPEAAPDLVDDGFEDAPSDMADES